MTAHDILPAESTKLRDYSVDLDLKCFPIPTVDFQIVEANLRQVRASR